MKTYEPEQVYSFQETRIEFEFPNNWHFCVVGCVWGLNCVNWNEFAHALIIALQMFLTFPALVLDIVLLAFVYLLCYPIFYILKGLFIGSGRFADKVIFPAILKIANILIVILLIVGLIAAFKLGLVLPFIDFIAKVITNFLN